MLTQNQSGYTQKYSQAQKCVNNMLVKCKKWQRKAENKNRAGKHIAHIKNTVYPTHVFIGHMVEQIGQS